MSKELDLETYLNISPQIFEIYLFDTKNLKNLYKQDLKFKDHTNIIDLNKLDQFLEENIFKIEKLIGKFVENVSLTIESHKIINLNLGIKKKNYSETIHKKNLENTITDVKDLFKENYQHSKILHITINRYLIDGISFSSFDDNLKGDHFCLELNIKSISLNSIREIEKILEKYQIKVNQYLDATYIRNFFKKENIEFSEMCYKIQKGFNFNEVKLIPKYSKKKGFFEKFFQLFS